MVINGFKKGKLKLGTRPINQLKQTYPIYKRNLFGAYFLCHMTFNALIKKNKFCSLFHDNFITSQSLFPDKLRFFPQATKENLKNSL